MLAAGPGRACPATLSSKRVRVELVWARYDLNFGEQGAMRLRPLRVDVDKTDGACEGAGSDEEPGGIRPQFPVTGVGKPDPGR